MGGITGINSIGAGAAVKATPAGPTPARFLRSAQNS